MTSAQQTVAERVQHLLQALRAELGIEEEDLRIGLLGRTGYLPEPSRMTMELDYAIRLVGCMLMLPPGRKVTIERMPPKDHNIYYLTISTPAPPEDSDA